MSYGESEYQDQVDDVVAELRRATALHGPMLSGHEGIAIIREEYMELEREIFWASAGTRRERMRAECVQLAAMAIRFLRDVCDAPPDGGR